jgi:hypothetical protein
MRAGMNGASNALTARWAATIDDASTVLSGAGVFPLLALLCVTATGQAREELHAVVGSASPFDFVDVLRRSPTTRMALGAWALDSLELTDWWRQTVPASMRGKLTGDQSADKEALDAWANEQTGGLVPQMPVQLTDETHLVLASALTVKTTWAQPFSDTPMELPAGPWAGRGLLAGLTRTDTDQDLVSVVDSDAGPLTLFTARGTDDIDVVLALGAPERTAGEVLSAAITALDSPGSRVTGSALPDGSTAPGIEIGWALSRGSDPLLQVSTMRFKVKGSHDLLAHKALFGLETATLDHFTHFPKISPQRLYVEGAQQDAIAIFTATGFEAAAVTAFAMGIRSAPSNEVRCVSVRFDRPFGFAAVHRPTGLVLVAGWVADPEPYQEDL